MRRAVLRRAGLRRLGGLRHRQAGRGRVPEPSAGFTACGIQRPPPARRAFPGCVAYDCFGAGQHLVQATFAGQDWRQFLRDGGAHVRRVRGHAPAPRAPSGTWPRALAGTAARAGPPLCSVPLEEIEALTREPADALLAADVAGHPAVDLRPAGAGERAGPGRGGIGDYLPCPLPPRCGPGRGGPARTGPAGRQPSRVGPHRRGPSPGRPAAGGHGGGGPAWGEPGWRRPARVRCSSPGPSWSPRTVTARYEPGGVARPVRPTGSRTADRHPRPAAELPAQAARVVVLGRRPTRYTTKRL